MIESLNNRNHYISSGENVFPYTFSITDKSHIAVSIDGVTKVLDFDYTVSGVGVAGGGNITFSSSTTVDSVVVFLLDVPQTQLLDLTAGVLDPEGIENSLDKSTRQILQHDESIGRSLKFPAQSIYKDIDVPDPVANGVLQWNSTANGLINGILIVGPQGPQGEIGPSGGETGPQGPAGPTGGNSFGTFAASGQANVISAQSNDVVTLLSSNGITITSNAAAKSLEFGVNAAANIQFGAVTVSSNTITNNGLILLQGAGTTKLRIGEAANNNWQLRFNINQNTTAVDNAAFASWAMVLGGGTTDSFSVHRAAAANLSFTHIFNVSNTGDVTIRSTSAFGMIGQHRTRYNNSGVIATIAGNQLLSTGSFTLINWIGSYDTDAIVSSSIFTCKLTGFYNFNMFVSWASSTTGQRILGYTKNGGATTYIAREAASTDDLVHPGVLGIYLTATDTIRFYGYQDSGSALNIQGSASFLSMVYLGE